MKKILLILSLALFSLTGVQAQLIKKIQKKETVAKADDTAYQAGKVPVVNGKVTFETTIAAKGLTAEQIKDKAEKWIAGRYVKPTIISANRFESNNPNTIILKGEEYIVFRNTFLVLSRARMYYYLTLTAEEGECKFHLSRITYWYDDEDDNGGIKMIAEDWITDETVFKKNGKMMKFGGKFRRKTIDLKDLLINELTQALNE